MYSEKKYSNRSKEHGQSVSADNEVGVRSVIVSIITCYCMHNDDINKGSKIVDICIYILFIISYVLRNLLDILLKLRSPLTLSANGN